MPTPIGIPIKVIALCLLVMVFSVAVPSLFLPAAGDYAIIYRGGSVSVNITGDFTQGVLAPKANDTSAFAPIPVLHTTLSGGNSSILVSLLFNAISAVASQARPEGIKFRADSNGTLLHYSLRFNVTGVSTASGTKQTIDLSWRSFSILDDFGASGVSINRMLPNYLESIILILANPGQPPAGIQEVHTWYMNSRVIIPSEVGGKTKDLTLLDFSSLSQPLGSWTAHRDFSSSQLTLQSTAGFNLTHSVHITEAEVSSTTVYNALNRLNAVIQAPLPLSINDNSLTFETGTGGWEPQLMLAAIVSLVVLTISIYLAEWRVLRPSRGGAKGKKR